jgi:hypothetical protein
VGQLQASNRDSQPNYWTNFRVLGQPYEFYVRGVGCVWGVCVGGGAGGGGPGAAAPVAADVEEAGALDLVLGLEVDLAPRPRARRHQAARRRPHEELRAGYGRGERAMLSARALSRMG